MKEFLIKNRIAVLIGVFFVVVVPLFVYGVMMIVGSIKEAVVESKAAKITEIVDQQFLSSVQAFRDDAKLIERHATAPPVLVADNDKAKVELFASVKQIALDTGNLNPSVTVVDEETRTRRARASDVTPEIVPVFDHYVQADISMTGTYQNFIDFVARMENMSYGADILGFAIAAREARASVRRGVAQDTSDVEDVRTDALAITVTFVVYTEPPADAEAEDVTLAGTEDGAEEGTEEGAE